MNHVYHLLSMISNQFKKMRDILFQLTNKRDSVVLDRPHTPHKAEEEDFLIILEEEKIAVV